MVKMARARALEVAYDDPEEARAIATARQRCAARDARLPGRGDARAKTAEGLETLEQNMRTRGKARGPMCSLRRRGARGVMASTRVALINSTNA